MMMSKTLAKQVKAKHKVAKTPPALPVYPSAARESVTQDSDASLQVLPITQEHSARMLLKSLRVLRDNWKLFGGITALYGGLVLLFGRGLAGLNNISDLKVALGSDNGITHILSGTTLFTYALGTSGNPGSSAAAAYQVMLGLIFCLALIWALRQLYAGKDIRIRDSFYAGMYPLVPFVLVLGVVLFQLLPFMVGAFLFGIVQTNGIAASGFELVLWGVLCLALLCASLYMIVPTIFSLLVACLPDVTPRAALAAGRELVQGRRWMVMRKLAFLPAILGMAAAVVLVPLFIVIAPLAAGLLFVASVAAVPVSIGYVYRLYRSLLT
jgi:hypothetical protein